MTVGSPLSGVCICVCVLLFATHMSTHYTIKVRTVLGIEDVLAGLTTSQACMRLKTWFLRLD